MDHAAVCGPQAARELRLARPDPLPAGPKLGQSWVRKPCAPDRSCRALARIAGSWLVAHRWRLVDRWTTHAAGRHAAAAQQAVNAVHECKRTYGRPILGSVPSSLVQIASHGLPAWHAARAPTRRAGMTIAGHVRRVRRRRHHVSRASCPAQTCYACSLLRVGCWGVLPLASGPYAVGAWECVRAAPAPVLGS